MVDWEGILSRDGPAVWRCAYRLLGRHDEAEDCFQETFLAALRAWEQERPVSHARALLLRLATARAMDRLRVRYRQAGREGVADWAAAADALPDPSPSPSSVAEMTELSARLCAALATLPERQAEAFCLHGLEGWRYDEIATEMNVSVHAVGVLLHRARAKLRVLLASAAPVERRRDANA